MSLRSYNGDTLYQRLEPGQKIDFYGTMSNVVVKIIHKWGEKYEHIGLGAIVNTNGYVLTSSHIFITGLEYKNVRVVTQHKHRYKVDFLCNVTNKEELTLLKIKRELGEVFDFANVESHEIRVGLVTHMMVHPHKKRYAWSSGLVGSVDTLVRDIESGNVLSLNPSIELIQMCHMNGGRDYDTGCSLSEGTPIFNNMGHIVGVYGFSFGALDYGIEVNADMINQHISKKDQGKKKKDKCLSST